MITSFSKNKIPAFWVTAIGSQSDGHVCSFLPPLTPIEKKRKAIYMVATICGKLLKKHIIQVIEMNCGKCGENENEYEPSQ